MKVEIDFDEALNEHCKDMRNGPGYLKPSVQDLTERLTKLVDTSRSYEEAAEALVAVIQGNGFIRDGVLAGLTKE